MNSNLKADCKTIFELDLAPIKAKLMHKELGEGWSAEQVAAVEGEYRRFLTLMKLFPHEEVSPFVTVDIFWHYHILDTMKYAVDCDQVFGYFLHHSPSAELQGEQAEDAHNRNGARMQELYETTFGEIYPLRETDHAAVNFSEAAVESAAWCVPTTTNRGSIQDVARKTAWCVPTMGNTASLQGVETKAAWCVPATAKRAPSQPAPLKTAWCVPAKTNPAPVQKTVAKTAWCVPTTVKAVSLQGLGTKTAWCVPTAANRTPPAPAHAKSAWCVPTSRNRAPSRSATANPAWCVPATVDRAWPQPVPAKTAWCVPSTKNPAWLQSATAKKVSSSPVPQNHSVYSNVVLALAA